MPTITGFNTFITKTNQNIIKSVKFIDLVFLPVIRQTKQKL